MAYQPQSPYGAGYNDGDDGYADSSYYNGYDYTDYPEYPGRSSHRSGLLSTSQLMTPRSPVSPAAYSNPSPSGYEAGAHSDAGTPPVYGSSTGSLGYLEHEEYAFDSQGSGSQTVDRTHERSRHRSSASSRGESSNTSGGESGGYVCLNPGCTTKPFKRNADLDRHYKHKHLPDNAKETYVCDYKNCARKHDSPFHRKDHFRDHLREYHNEDLGKRGKNVSSDWVENRNVKKDWWRCTRCLGRVSIKKNSFECPLCKTSCDQTRALSRKSL